MPGKACFVQQDRLPGSFSDTAADQPDSRAPLILVVDDEAMILHMLRDVLELAGYTVLVAPNGQVGLARALAAPPDLILTDVMMPVMDGHALCRQLRAEPRLAHIPIVAMSAAYRPHADDAFDAIIAKPFEIAALLALVEGWLAGGS
jgi:CheY-like chemotaxis protein